MQAVISPPVRKEIWRGARFEKSLEGETTLAAMLVEICAMTTITIASTSSTGRSASSWATSATGSQIGLPYSTIVAEVTAMPMNENPVIVSGMAMLWPSSCERWSLAYRVKSGMFIDSVIQYPPFAPSPGPNSDQKLPWSVISFEEAENTFPPTPKPQISSATLEPSSSGAAQLSRNLMPSMPRRMIATWTSQKTPKAIALWAVTSDQPLHSVVMRVSSASAPIHVWMPNQPQATSARAMAATFAPRMPKLDRTSTGNGIPYFVPACELSRIGMRTRKLPSDTVSSPCHHVMPAAMRPAASVYVVMTIE